MNTRLELQKFLEEVLGSRNVYYQPPETIKLKYPAIVYSKNRINNKFADDVCYLQNNSYELTVIDSDPDSEIVDRISKLPTIKFDRQFKSNNLNHYVFTIIYK